MVGKYCVTNTPGIYHIHKIIVKVIRQYNAVSWLCRPIKYNPVHEGRDMWFLENELAEVVPLNRKLR